MPAVVRIGDSLSTGHLCDSTTTISSTPQSTVKANGILIAVVGALTSLHFWPDPACVPHVGPPYPKLNAGSSTVRIEGIAVGRIGDSADLGAMTTGSPNVFVGD